MPRREAAIKRPPRDWGLTSGPLRGACRPLKAGHEEPGRSEHGSTSHPKSSPNRTRAWMRWVVRVRELPLGRCGIALSGSASPSPLLGAPRFRHRIYREPRTILATIGTRCATAAPGVRVRHRGFADPRLHHRGGRALLLRGCLARLFPGAPGSPDEVRRRRGAGCVWVFGAGRASSVRRTPVLPGPS